MVERHEREVGTGVDDERITLDALDRADARMLRTTLLRKSPAPVRMPWPVMRAPCSPAMFSKNESLPRKPGVFMFATLLLTVSRLREKLKSPDRLLKSA